LLRGRRALVALAALVALVPGCGFLDGLDGGANGEPAEQAFPVPDEAHEVELIVAEGPEGSTLAFVPVFIDGQGPFSFALDTGASSTLVGTELASELGLADVGPAPPLAGIGGGARGRIVEVDAWRVGDVPLLPKEVVSAELPGDDVQGLLGSDILSNFGVITVDYGVGTLYLEPREDEA
jgi:predicted aspartyl protease